MYVNGGRSNWLVTPRQTPTRPHGVLGHLHLPSALTYLIGTSWRISLTNITSNGAQRGRSAPHLLGIPLRNQSESALT